MLYTINKTITATTTIAMADKGFDHDRLFVRPTSVGSKFVIAVVRCVREPRSASDPTGGSVTT